MRLQLTLVLVVTQVLASLASTPVQADSVVVGTGTPASCTDAAINAALPLLRDGIGGQFPGGTMTFNCGPAQHVIAVGIQKFLYGQITIDGGNKVVLNGQNATRLFHVALPGSNPEDRTEVSIRNLTMIGGYANADFGGAILVRAGARLDVDGIVIAGSKADLAGGAIGSEPSTVLNISNSIFNNNLALTGGGAIATSAITVVNNSSFSENVSAFTQGGAIQSWVAPLTIHNSTFSDNRAGVGGAIFKQEAELTITQSVLVNNVASDQGGGALMLRQTNADVRDSEIRANVASGTGRGGGIHIYDDGNIVTRRTVIENNRADQGGGAYASALNTGMGGSVVETQNLRIWQGSSVIRNEAREGGGVYIAGVGLFNGGRSGRLSLLDSRIERNLAMNGGGVYSQGALTIGNARISANVAQQNGGGLYLAPTFVGTASITDTETGSNTFDKATVEGNSAGAYGGGIYATLAKMNTFSALIRGNRADQRGGGIALEGVYYFPLQRVSLIENSAELAGGGLYVEQAFGTVTVERSTFSANRTTQSTGSGGQVYVGTGSSFGPSRVFLFDNTLYGGQASAGSNLYAAAGGQISYARSVVATLGSMGCSSDGDGQVATLGSNVLMGFSCPFDVNNDIGVALESSLKLEPLAYNGIDTTSGFALTHLPAPGSPIIDNHNCPPVAPGNAPRLDQRGLATGVDGDNDLVGLCDAGAIERQSVEVSVLFKEGFE